MTATPLLWTPDGGGYVAACGRHTVRVAPLSAPSPRWFAYGPGFQLLDCNPGTGRASWPTLEEAQAAAEASLPRKGPPPKGHVRVGWRVPRAIAEAVEAGAEAAGVTPGEHVAHLIGLTMEAEP
jgi:hypothetical protein